MENENFPPPIDLATVVATAAFFYRWAVYPVTPSIYIYGWNPTISKTFSSIELWYRHTSKWTSHLDYPIKYASSSDLPSWHLRVSLAIHASHAFYSPSSFRELVVSKGDRPSYDWARLHRFYETRERYNGDTGEGEFKGCRKLSQCRRRFDLLSRMCGVWRVIMLRTIVNVMKTGKSERFCFLIMFVIYRGSFLVERYPIQNVFILWNFSYKSRQFGMSLITNKGNKVDEIELICTILEF